MSEIKKLESLQIVDSRGNPTLEVTAILGSGPRAIMRRDLAPEARVLSQAETKLN